MNKFVMLVTLVHVTFCSLKQKLRKKRKHLQEAMKRLKKKMKMRRR